MDKQQLQEQQAQIQDLLNDNSLLKGITIDTLSGKIKIVNKRRIVTLLNYLYLILQQEIDYETNN